MNWHKGIAKLHEDIANNVERYQNGILPIHPKKLLPNGVLCPFYWAISNMNCMYYYIGTPRNWYILYNVTIWVHVWVVAIQLTKYTPFPLVYFPLHLYLLKVKVICVLISILRKQSWNSSWDLEKLLRRIIFYQSGAPILHTTVQGHIIITYGEFNGTNSISKVTTFIFRILSTCFAY